MSRAPEFPSTRDAGRLRFEVSRPQNPQSHAHDQPHHGVVGRGKPAAFATTSVPVCCAGVSAAGVEAARAFQRQIFAETLVPRLDRGTGSDARGAVRRGGAGRLRGTVPTRHRRLSEEEEEVEEEMKW